LLFCVPENCRVAASPYPTYGTSGRIRLRTALAVHPNRGGGLNQPRPRVAVHPRRQRFPNLLMIIIQPLLLLLG